MFDLEAAISEWRAQMVAAGIQSPAPLDELESHLREEIEQQTKAGLNPAEAFQTAVQKIGGAQILQREFKKVNSGRRIIRATLVIVGWLALSLTLLWGGIGLDLDWNFFNWSPHLNLRAIIDITVLVASLIAMFFLAKATRGRVSRVVSLLICLAIFSLMLATSGPEPRTSGWFGRSRPSPFWFRGGLVLVFATPGAFWFWSLKRQSTAQHNERADHHGLKYPTSHA